MNNPDILSLFGKEVELPTLPQVITKIMNLLADPHSTAQDITQVMQMDPALASSVLRLANSSYYGLRKTISSVRQGVVVLGFSTIKNLAISASVFDLFDTTINGNLNYEDFWNHATGTAQAAKIIAEQHATVDIDPDTAFMAGLLHDIGIILIEQYAPDLFDDILDLSDDENISYDRAEFKLTGVTHGQIGAEIARNWGLPPDLITAIKDHHVVNFGEAAQPLTKTVHFADYICDHHHIGASGGVVEEAFALDTIDVLGIAFNKESDVIEQVKEAVQSNGSWFK